MPFVDRRVRVRVNNHLVKKRNKELDPISFRPDKIVRGYLGRVYYTSKFINRSIHFHILMITNPKQIMKELKMRYPNQWKKINRQKF